MKYGAALFLVFILALSAAAQQPDSAAMRKDTSLIVTAKKLDTIPKKMDSAIKAKHSPHKAAIRSAIIPGWGQAYNKKYWKIPVVYTALGIPAYLFVDNLKWYRKTNYAYAVAVSGTNNPDSLSKVDPDLLPFVQRGRTTELVNYRNEFRRNMDYSALFFLIFWGLQIVDATVDAHLQGFDVTPDLSMKLKPNFNANNSNTYGVSLVFDIHKGKPRMWNNNQ